MRPSTFRPILGITLLFGSLGTTFGAGCGKSEDVAIGKVTTTSEEGDLCSSEESCGPTPDVATVICADGSKGGFTGRCLASADGSCDWEIRTCPENEGPGTCSPEACGPTPDVPTVICADGSTGGLTGQCLPDASGTCAWEIRHCPEAEGPGTDPGDPTDPPGGCTPEACGPTPDVATVICADGSKGGFTGQCSPDASGACTWEIRQCPN